MIDKSSAEWKAFWVQRWRARQRGVGFELTFAQWTRLWKLHFHERGRRRGQYVMARKGDAGPYALGNVRICKVEENRSEQKSRKGVPFSETHLANLRLARGHEARNRGWHHSPESRAKISAANKGKASRGYGWRHSPETKAKMSHSQRVRLSL